MINFSKPAQVVKVLALAAFLLASVQTASAADDMKDCELFNFTDRTVTQVYMCAADVDINEYGMNIRFSIPPNIATTISESFSIMATSSIGQTSIAPTCTG